MGRSRAVGNLDRTAGEGCNAAESAWPCPAAALPQHPENRKYMYRNRKQITNGH